jgi:RNA polymerase sigma-70 factor, ECF subfamily
MTRSTALPIEATVRGRAIDWKGFYDEHFELVWRLLARFGAPETDIEDLAQDVFVIAHRQLPGFRWEASPKTWLYTICRRVAAGARRRDRIRRAAHLLLRRPKPYAETQSAGLARHDLARLLAHLPEPQRMALLLHEVDEMGVPQIAEICGCPEATVWSRLRLAWNALKERGT